MVGAAGHVARGDSSRIVRHFVSLDRSDGVTHASESACEAMAVFENDGGWDDATAPRPRPAWARATQRREETRSGSCVPAGFGSIRNLKHLATGLLVHAPRVPAEYVS